MTRFPKPELTNLQEQIDALSSGGAAVYALVANGIVANGVDAGTVFTATVGKEYLLCAVVGSSPGGSPKTFSPGDEDLFTLTGIELGVGRFDNPFSLTQNGAEGDKNGVQANEVSYIAVGAGRLGNASTTNNGDGIGGERETMQVELNGDGTITAEHTANGSTSNGIFLVYER